ncbi:hypothetical protein HDV63DRAFT_365212 [Trichoderma sp. SZMC 28014]
MVTLLGNKASGGTWQQNIGNCLSLVHHQVTKITNIQAHIVLHRAAAPSTPESDKPIEGKSGCAQACDLGTAAGGNKKQRVGFFTKIAIFAVLLADIWFRYSIITSTVLLLV